MVPPEDIVVGNGDPCDTVCSKCLSVNIQGENFVDVDNLTCHYRIVHVRTANTRVSKSQRKNMFYLLVTLK